MKKLHIPVYNRIKLNSFHPLCKNDLGKRAIQNYNLPPFIDSSCRREPDFENEYPSISSICRGSKFAPHLKMNDIVVYITIKGNYEPYEQNHYRIVAILQVIDIYKTHQIGQIEYSKLNVTVPSNCMVANNPPNRFERTAGNFDTSKQIKQFLGNTPANQATIGASRLYHWNNAYLWRSNQWPSFIRTKTIYKNYHNPVPLFQSDADKIFNEKMGTRSGKRITKEQLTTLGKYVGIDINMD